jgi:hypothetical protein
MPTTVCLYADTLYYPQGGGHSWVYLNWALGLRSLGCEVVWLERLRGRYTDPQDEEAYFNALKARLKRYGLERIALWSPSGRQPPQEVTEQCLDLDSVVGADLLLALRYDLPSRLVSSFRRSALLDIDPGLLQTWISKGQIEPARYTRYFTTGETVGMPGARFPDAGLEWHYAPPCVALDWWPVCPADEGAPFTTVSHWYMSTWMEDGGEAYPNDKRDGFLPFLDLPRHTAQPLELALYLDGDRTERTALEARGWRVRESVEVAATPWDYQGYIQASRGEFSCVKPSCVRMQNAWISDRTLCYLASGKPAVVQHTGPSRFLPDAAGLFRFSDLGEAARCLDAVASDYERHGRLARALAEEHFDARKVVGSVLERAL